MSDVCPSVVHKKQFKREIGNPQGESLDNNTTGLQQPAGVKNKTQFKNSSTAETIVSGEIPVAKTLYYGE